MIVQLVSRGCDAKRSIGSMIVCVLMAALGAAPGAEGAEMTRIEDVLVATYEFSAASEGTTFDVKAAYHLWLPPDVKVVRAIIVHQHGAGPGATADGPRVAQDLHWRALAAKWSCALIGPQYAHAPGGARAWSNSDRGSGKVFLQALSDFTRETRHAELSTAPWALWGHSAGGGWSSGMIRKYPDRTLALCSKSGGGIDRNASEPLPIEGSFAELPVMCIYGQNERDGEAPGYRASWLRASASCEQWRAKGGLAAFASIPKTAHECGNSRFLAIPFLDACLAQRLPQPGKTALRPVNRDGVWLGDGQSCEIAPAAKYRGDPAKAAWFPNEATARAWQVLVRTGGVEDATPPERAPVISGVKRIGGVTLEVRWTAWADLESGIRCFEILRDGEKVAETVSPPGRSAIPQFQPIGFHDTPTTETPSMVFRDTAAAPGAEHTYQIVAVNGAGLRSQPSAGAKAERQIP